jgi:hypothetical protein
VKAANVSCGQCDHALGAQSGVQYLQVSEWIGKVFDAIEKANG